MDTPVSPSSLGVIDIIKRSLVVYQKIMGRLVGYFFLVAILGGIVFAIGAIVAVLTTGFSLASLKNGDLSSPAFLGNALSHFGALLVIIPIFFILFFIIQLWFQATVILTASRANANIQQNSWAGTLGEAGKSLGRLILGALPKALISIVPVLFIYGALFSILFSIGAKTQANLGPMLLLMLGGIVFSFVSFYFNVRWFFTEYAILLEKLRPIEGLRRSSEIVRGRWWGVFGKILGIGLALWLGVFIALFILQIIFGKNSGITSFVSFVLQLFVTPLIFTTFTILFEGLRANPVQPAAPAAPASIQTPPAPQA